MPVETDKYLLIETRLGRPLEEQLRYWDTHRVPATAMARLLAAETGVRLTGECVREWIRRLNGTAA